MNLHESASFVSRLLYDSQIGCLACDTIFSGWFYDASHQPFATSRGILQLIPSTSSDKRRTAVPPRCAVWQFCCKRGFADLCSLPIWPFMGILMESSELLAVKCRMTRTSRLGAEIDEMICRKMEFCRRMPRWTEAFLPRSLNAQSACRVLTKDRAA